MVEQQPAKRVKAAKEAASAQQPQRKVARWSSKSVNHLQVEFWVTGIMRTIQNTPKIAPLRIPKNIVNPNEVAGIQITRHESPQRKVRLVATPNRPKRSLATPIKGRPIAVPMFKKAVTCVACCLDNPMEIEKSESE